MQKEIKVPRARKPILVVDFDGVIHSYRSGWKGESIINDPPVPGALAFLKEALDSFRVCIYSSRSSTKTGVNAMQRYIEKHCRESWHVPWWLDLEWPQSKPSAFVTLDDRAVTFTGKFPHVHDLVMFRTWLEEERDTPVLEPNEGEPNA